MGFFNFVQSLFSYNGKLNTVACPYCLRENSLSAKKCSGCSGDLTENYKRHYSRDKLLAVPIIGYTSSGKSVFVDSLVCTMLDLSDKQHWSKFEGTPVDTDTEKWLYEVILPNRAKDKVPLATNREDNFKRVLLIKGIPLWGDRIFTLRDVAGEHFEGFTFSEDVKEYIKQSKCAIFMIDVNEVLSDPALQFHTLFQRYVRTIIESGDSPRDRKIIIVLSKADLYRERLPKNLLEYLNNDPLYQANGGNSKPFFIDLSDPSALNNHAKVILPMIDQQLSSWIATLGNGGSQLLAQAKSEGVEIRFTIVSGWGSKPQLGATVNPLRMLDPLLWLLEFHSREV